MSKTVVVRYRTTSEAAEENQRLIEQVYAELASDEPEGLRYLTLRLADGVTFVHVALREGAATLSDVAAFGEFQRDLGARVEAPPDASPATLVGSYRMFGESVQS
jgi:hypothetical protein